MKNYDHYLALDWAQSNMAVAHATKHSERIDTIDVRSDIKALKAYLRGFKGRKILTFEETSPAQWLYTELIDEVDEILVCEPYSNHLMKTGPKNDRVDAIKLLRLLRAEMLKPVFHCTDEFVNVRKLVSGHGDLIQSLVQAKNQRLSMFRAKGMKKGETFTSAEERFVIEQLEALITCQEELRAKYKSEFERIYQQSQTVQNLATIPGIGLIGAVKIAATVIDAKRFKHKTGFWLYCGLQKYELISGGKCYGKRSPRYSRRLKSVFKTAAVTCARRNNPNPLRDYYDEMINAGLPEHHARHNLARRIATLALGVMKTGKQLNLKNQAC